MGRPSSFAVSIHSRIITSTFSQRLLIALTVGCASWEFRDFGDECLVFFTPVNNHSILEHPKPQADISI
jgi:hypothetical protein